MHGRIGTESEIVQQASGGVRCMGAWLACFSAWRHWTATCGWFTQLVSPALHPAQLPMCGLYADGEIGPEVCNGRSGLCWAGQALPATIDGGAAARASSSGPAAAGSKLQGFTTIVTSYCA